MLEAMNTYKKYLFKLSITFFGNYFPLTDNKSFISLLILHVYLQILSSHKAKGYFQIVGMSDLRSGICVRSELTY